MQNFKCLLFVLFATLVSGYENIDADKTVVKEEWRNLEKTLEQELQKSPENIHCRLRPESPLCQAAGNKQAFLSKLFNSWKDEARVKLQSSHADRKRDKTCRPRPGASWCTGKREFESFSSSQNGEMTKPGFTDIKEAEDDKIASIQARLGEERLRI